MEARNDQLPVAAEPREERAVVRRPGTETFSKGPLSPCAQSPLPAILTVGPRMERLIARNFLANIRAGSSKVSVTMYLTKILRTLPRLWSNSTLPLNPVLVRRPIVAVQRMPRYLACAETWASNEAPRPGARSNYRGAFDVVSARSRWGRCSLRVSVPELRRLADRTCREDGVDSSANSLHQRALCGTM